MVFFYEYFDGSFGCFYMFCFNNLVVVCLGFLEFGGFDELMCCVVVED